MKLSDKVKFIARVFGKDDALRELVSELGDDVEKLETEYDRRLEAFRVSTNETEHEVRVIDGARSDAIERLRNLAGALRDLSPGPHPGPMNCEDFVPLIASRIDALEHQCKSLSAALDMEKAEQSDRVFAAIKPLADRAQAAEQLVCDMLPAFQPPPSTPEHWARWNDILARARAVKERMG